MVSLEQKEHDLDILTLDQGWNDNNEKFIVKIGEKSASFKYMHENLAKNYIFYDRVFKLFIAISTVIATSINIFQAGIIIQTTIGGVISVISLVYNFLNFSELSKDHTHYASLFTITYHDIRNIMCLYRKDRPAAIKYIQHTIKEYDQLEVNGPNIPKWQLSKFEKEFKSKDICIPELDDKVQKIEIIIEPNKPKTTIKNNPDDYVIDFTINNSNNLHEIQEIFNINGDLSEKNNITNEDLIKRKSNLTKQSDYEMKRFMSNIKNPD